MNHYLAQQLNIEPAAGNIVPIEGPLVGINNLSDLIGVVMLFVYPFAGVILLIVLILGGFDLLTSQGVAEKVSSGKAKLTAGLAGFVLLAISFIISKLIGFIFGVGGGIL